MSGTWGLIKQFLLPDFHTEGDPFSLGRWDADQPEPDCASPPQLPKAYTPPADQQQLYPSLEENLSRLAAEFSAHQNQGLTLRWLDLQTTPAVRALLLFMQGMIDEQRLQQGVVQSLLTKATGRPPTPAAMRQVVAGESLSLTADWSKLVNGLLSGSAVLLMDCAPEALMIDLTGWTTRSIPEAKNEPTIMGPQEALTEDLRTNLTMLRRRLRTPDLIVAWGSVGRRSRVDVALLYLKGVANPKLVAEAHRRVAAVAHRIDYVADCGSMAQLIGERPMSLYPSLVITERPDRLAMQIANGYVVLMVDNDPHGLVLPSTFPSFFHSPEDHYLRWPFATFLRLTRVLAYCITLLLPALYVALVNYRQEMIPTPLLLAIAGSRETVPFSTVMEVLMMEILFELIREAAVRVPTIVGPTIGIVGTLVLGQAAVQAGVISPIMVIITSTTALTSFAIPQYELQYGARLLRFAYITAASLLGLVGLLVLLVLQTAHLASGSSFGVPYFAPMVPSRRGSESLFSRRPTVDEEQRPQTVRPVNPRSAQSVVRPWDPGSGDAQGGGQE